MTSIYLCLHNNFWDLHIFFVTTKSHGCLSNVMLLWPNYKESLCTNSIIFSQPLCISANVKTKEQVPAIVNKFEMENDSSYNYADESAASEPILLQRPPDLRKYENNGVTLKKYFNFYHVIHCRNNNLTYRMESQARPRGFWSRIQVYKHDSREISEEDNRKDTSSEDHRHQTDSVERLEVKGYPDQHPKPYTGSKQARGDLPVRRRKRQFDSRWIRWSRALAGDSRRNTDSLGAETLVHASDGCQYECETDFGSYPCSVVFFMTLRLLQHFLKNKNHFYFSHYKRISSRNFQSLFGVRKSTWRLLYSWSFVVSTDSIQCN